MNIDWQRVVLNIRRAGMSCPAQARRLGHKDSGARLQRIARGELRRVWFDEGLALLDLHHALCPELHNIAALLRAERSAGGITRLSIVPVAVSRAA